MLNNHLSRFLRDERGSYTVWSLVWFMLYVAIGGLAVDMTDAYRNQTLLQSTADAAALAGVMSLPDDGDAVAQALNYAADNMGQNPHGIVLTAEDVFVGTWNFASESFTAGTSDPNAVYVITRRAEQNANPLALNFLRILALFGFDPQWNINTDAVAVQGINACLNNGIVAGGELTMTTHSDFWEEICLHGTDGIKLTNHNYFEPGVIASVGCAKGQQHCLRPNEGLALSDDDFAEAFGVAPDGGGGNYEDPLQPTNAKKAGAYIEDLIDLGSEGYDSFGEFLEAKNDNKTFYDGWSYLAPDGTGVPNYYTGPSLPGNAVIPHGTAEEDIEGKYTIYHIECNNQLSLPSGIYRNMAIVATCPIHVNNANLDIQETVMAVDWQGNQGFHVAGQIDIGSDDCSVPGLEIYTNASNVHFASSANVNNVRILANGEVSFAAGGFGHVGIDIEATSNVEMASDGDFGLCPGGPGGGPQSWAYSLVR